MKQTLNIGFQGELGAYSQFAAKNLFGNQVQTVGYRYFEQVFKALKNQQIDFGVLPIENSLAGSIRENFDLLQKYDFNIIGETQLEIQHALIGFPNVSLKNISKVYSHPQALSQCSDFLKSHTFLKSKPFYDTAGAVKRVAEKKEYNCVAIANQFAAEYYGLTVIKNSISNQLQNYTRFIVIAPPETSFSFKGSNKYKTSISFSPKQEQQGILFKLLSIFAQRDINFLRIESRPIPSNTFKYLFYIDFENDLNNSNLSSKTQEALNLLSQECDSFKNYGTYPVGQKTKVK